ncbi:MAG: DUF4864 domain-containing protein [Burkholderiaceae bacterium]
MQHATRRTVWATVLAAVFAAVLAAVFATVFATLASQVRTAWAAPPEVSAEDAQAIRAVVQAQLAAFRSDDAEKAFSYASPAIRAQFLVADHFLAMVRGAYPVVYHPHSLGFLLAQRIDGAVIQRVRMTDAAGAAWLAIYRMQQQPDRSWRIDGCVMTRDDRPTA